MLAQFAALEITPDSTWSAIQNQYLKLSEYWNPERFTYNSGERRKAEFRFRQITRAFKYLKEHRELFEDKQKLSAEKTSCFSSLGNIPLNHQQSALFSTRRDMSHNLRVGRMLLALSSLWPYNKPAPWGIKAPRNNYFKQIFHAVMWIYHMVTLPIEVTLRLISAVLYRFRLQIVFVIIALLFMRESKIHLNIDGGVNSKQVHVKQTQKNTMVLRNLLFN